MKLLLKNEMDKFVAGRTELWDLCAVRNRYKRLRCAGLMDNISLVHWLLTDGLQHLLK